ncbi:hypothetical protein [Borrelia crocidurae]|uniref:hypothetical protein n=1 Tax=Borrelia crocidurae TaxID=29520 RepID=UPI00046D133A|nr:hypothetical protein [Borrelia crocidurae]
MISKYDKKDINNIEFSIIDSLRLNFKFFYFFFLLINKCSLTESLFNIKISAVIMQSFNISKYLYFYLAIY